MPVFGSWSASFRSSLHIAFRMVLLLWIIHAVQWLSGFRFYLFGGLFPRTIEGIKGIFLSPFLHGDLAHLLSNSAPLLVLTFLIFFFYREFAWRSILSIYLLTGISVWLFGRPVYHIGASGVIYGMVAFIFWSGIFQRNLRSIVLGLVVAVLYSGMFLGVLPNQEGISWESHLLGALAGIVVAFIQRREMREHYRDPEPQYDPGDEEKRFFLDRDTFERRRSERW